MLASENPNARRGPARTGRPPREQAGEVERRILDAAERVFLEHGFGEATVEQIADVARAGKPTIYARFAGGKEALFTAVMARMIGRSTGLDTIEASGSTIEERLSSVATALVAGFLEPDSVGLIRAVIAEAHRFPDLAATVKQMARARWSETIAQLLRELAQSHETKSWPGFAPDQIAVNASCFQELVLLPLLMRALFGENVETLRGEAAIHVRRAVSFFLAACGRGG